MMRGLPGVLVAWVCMLGVLPGCRAAQSPEPITAELRYPDREPIAFTFVYVPGDPGAGIEPFYMAEHEVTWDMFLDWSSGAGLEDREYAELMRQRLRPSPLYEDCVQLHMGLDNRPALSMSLLCAQAYARWVSEQTGLNVSIPTDAQWQHALALGGGVPDSRAALLQQGVFFNNAEPYETEFRVRGHPVLTRSAPVGSKQPNALGIYDMLGNAAEWVTDTGDGRMVRGGHFLLDLDETPFDADWCAVEDLSVWNETWPGVPYTLFWYRDHYYQGIRLVCEVP